MKVGVLYIVIGDYSKFWKDFYLSSEKFFSPGINKQYFVFSDRPIEERNNVFVFSQSDLGWPGNTLYRFKMFLSKEELLKNCDYLFFFNANTLFKRTIILNELLPTKNDNYLTALSWQINKENKDFPYERNPLSTAYIEFGKGSYYYQGGLNGGRTPEYLELMHHCMSNIDLDWAKAIVAVNNDESHINQYLLNKKIKVLSTKYGRPEEWSFPLFPKIIFRDKNKILGRKYILSLKNKKITPKYSLFRFISKIRKRILCML